jgi:hypothetical protein
VGKLYILFEAARPIWRVLREFAFANFEMRSSSTVKLRWRQERNGPSQRGDEIAADLYEVASQRFANRFHRKLFGDQDARPSPVRTRRVLSTKRLVTTPSVTEITARLVRRCSS